MDNLVNIVMPIFEGKKEVVVGSKVSQSENDELLRICQKEDRSMSYVLRELAMRGLVLYLQDNHLKTTEEEILTAKAILARADQEFIEVEDRGALDDDTINYKRKLA